MHDKIRTLVAWFTLGAAVTAGAVSPAGYEAKAQELDWVTSAGSSILDSGTAVAVDVRGNSYVTGFLRASPFGTSGFDTFVAKYAPDGTPLWFNTTSGTSSDIDVGSGMAADRRGNSYVTGRFRGMVTFGADEADDITLESAGGTDMFVAKFATDGSLLWATSAGGADTQQGNDIAVDLHDNSYVTGGFQDEAMFGAGEANQTVLESAGGTDMFVAKFATDGSLLWATSAGGNDNVGVGIAADRGGNSYVTGRFRNTLTLGAGETNETTLESAGGTDVFVAKYAPDGSLLWATSAGGSSGSPPNDVGFGVATDPRGNIYVTGRFVGTATFGGDEGDETALELESAGGTDMFVAKYAPDGSLLWAKSVGGADNDAGNGIATDPRGNSYVTGGFVGTATFGGDEGDETALELESAGGADVFVAKYAPDGSFLWATSAGGADGDGGFGVATHRGGRSYVTGGFQGTATFGAGEANETMLESEGENDVFVAKYRR